MAVVGAVYRHNPAVQVADLDGNISLYADGQPQAVLLNDTASAIWRLLDAGLPLPEIVGQLSASYAVDGSSIIDDVRSTVEELVRLGFVVHA